MKRFRLVDNLMGWLIFAVAAFTYCSTIEPTASFWDCPEFITTGYKLEVGHPPGAPFFMLTANIFSQFVSDPASVAKMVNTMSALLSAFCILFLYWTISHLVRRLICKDGKVETIAQLISIEASAVVGALAYTWSDTFWFSAVEGEVYAYSSLFTALVVWLMLKWEDCADDPRSDRWLILIAYMTGLSIGVHLLNLLCLPALVLIYYYRKFTNVDMKGTFMALFVSVILLAAVLYGIVPGIVKVGGWSELLFVNVLGMPFNTGLIIYIIALVGTVVWAIWETHRGVNANRTNLAYLLSIALLGIPFYDHGVKSVVIGLILLAILAWVLWFKSWLTPRLKSTSLLCMLMIMIGYSSYAVIVIRSAANTPMDQNSPEDIFTLGQYLNREQYGDRPLFYGQTFTSELKWDSNGNPVKTQGAPVYQRVEKADPSQPDEYKIIRTNDKYQYQYNMLFPRMYDDGHEYDYRNMLPGGFKGKPVQMTDRYGRAYTAYVPTFWENLQFFIGYQVSNMYLRYFMWNFAGRQNDLQNGSGYDIERGNWISGISVLDNARLGDQSKLPDDLKGNKGHNVYYMLPLLLGLIGMFWQIMRNDESVKQFWVVFFLFFMTGLAIVIYLNQTPGQPRERDYAYAGSFYAFAIWIGMAVVAITDILNRFIKKDSKQLKLATALIPCVCVAVPLQMAAQNWDDHDRSGRYCCRDFGQNYLSCLSSEGNPIIFTNGDNDTFPLWYAQETEGFRTDARVCNLSYLQTDWYIDQMKRPAYDSPSLPISWPRLQYVTGTNEAVMVLPNILEDVIKDLGNKGYGEDEIRKIFGGNPFELRTIIDKWILNKDPEIVNLKNNLRLDAEAKMANCESQMQDAMSKGNEDHARYYQQMYELYRFRSKYIDGPIFPTENLQITVDKAAVKKSGMKIPGDSIPDVMNISLANHNAVYKSELMMLEMLANANWVRPMYVAVTVGESAYGSLGDNFIQEGLVYRITPFTTKGNVYDTDKMYDNIMHKFKFGGIEHPGLYLDETVMRMCWTHRRMFSLLASELVEEDKMDRVQKVLEYADKMIPGASVPHSLASGSNELADAWAVIGKYDKAMEIADQLKKIGGQYLDWYAYSSAAGKRDLNFSLCYRDGIRPFTSTFNIYLDAANQLARHGKKNDAKAIFDKLMQESDMCGKWFNAALVSGHLDGQYANIFMSEYMRVTQLMESIEECTSAANIAMDPSTKDLCQNHINSLNMRYMEMQKRNEER